MNNRNKMVLGIVVIILITIIGIYFYSKHSMGSSLMTVQTEGDQPVSLENATYSLKTPDQLPITQYPKAYGVELDFVANGSTLPSMLCLKVAADIPIKAFNIPGHPNDASTTIPSTKYGGAYEGITCFSGGITSEEDTMVYFNTRPSEINASLTTSDIL